MGTILKNAVYLENGTIVNNYSKTGIENPALLLDCETGALFKWGNKDAVYASYIKASEAYQKTGALDMAERLMYIELDAMQLTPEQRCYILKRCIQYTASRFQTELCSKIQHDTGDGACIAWLNAEMARVPLDLTAQD